MYKAEQKRTEFKTTITNLEDYYRSLEMEIEVNRADDFSIQRIAQLTQKTNQFNMTTRRYSEGDIKRFVQSANHNVLYIKVNDKFGSSGLVGVSILEYKKNEALIDTFLLSCRILGRGIENVFLTATLLAAQKHGSQTIKAEYIPSAKNSLAEPFYPDNGFTLKKSGKTSKTFSFALDLLNKSNYPSYIETVNINF